MELQEPFQETGFQRWRRTFPWLHLLRVPGIAGRGRMLLTGFLFSLLLMLYGFSSGQGGELSLLNRGTLTAPYYAMTHLFSNWHLFPNETLYLLIHTWGRENAVLLRYHLLGTLFLHALSGLVLCRMAAGLFTTGHNLGIASSFRFGIRKLPALLTSLVFPLLVVGVAYTLGRGLLFVGQITVIKSWAEGIAYGLALPWMFLLMLVLAGLVVGWPLLVATLATENTDGFDVWSRGFDYFRSRFVSSLICFSLAMFMGMFVLSIFAELSRLTFAFMDYLLHRDMLRERFGDHIPMIQTPFADEWPQGFWRRIWGCLLSGYGMSVYWTSVTATYVLARRSVDRIPLEEFRR